MRRKLFLILTLLVISDNVFGKNGNKTKQIKSIKKHVSNDKYKINSARAKRSSDDGTGKILLFGKENIIEDPNQYDYLDGRAKDFNSKSAIEKELPFWGNRGRRESSSEETVPDVRLPTPTHYKDNKNFHKLLLNLQDTLRDEVHPFWSNRGRRDSDDSKDDDNPPLDLFWANRGRRQDDDPFWGTRGRRQDNNDSPFWGNRGRRENAVSQSHWSSREGLDEDEPFWGNRGRRQEEEPFWGNRGRREAFEAYSGNAKYKSKSHYSYKDLLNEKNYLKDAIIDAIDDIRNTNDNFERNRREEIPAPFWINRGRDSKLKTLFNGVARNRMLFNPNTANKLSTNELHSKTFQQNTVHDDRIYAEEPHYIIVERSSRSSAEDDPFFITRGKKFSPLNVAKAVRDRRGALQDIVKSVRNDPYNIVRGKKDYIPIGSSNTTETQFTKTRDLICSSVDLLTMKHSQGNKLKREVLDKDRDRRTTLKKLALQLQMDPYFVSRGKRDGENINLNDLEQFINKVIVLCN